MTLCGAGRRSRGFPGKAPRFASPSEARPSRVITAMHSPIVRISNKMPDPLSHAPSSTVSGLDAV